jgi:hypothetical protein
MEVDSEEDVEELIDECLSTKPRGLECVRECLQKKDHCLSQSR